MSMVVFNWAAIFLAILTFPCLYKACVGPTSTDRVISINVIATKTTIIIALLTVLTGEDIFINVSLLYSMIGFTSTVCICKYIDKGTLL
ncbi:MAG: cation:proton antiporter [Clostridiaceae bacterium]|nr:cation:proton antiporter [Clostridiaceae bacterium]